MTNSIEDRADGSIALFIDGDLQFDSRDEAIYHEGLVLPALAVTLSRKDTNKKVLIIGGGDGLSAREVLKSNKVSQVDLVDYDPEIIDLAKNQFKQFNNASLSDARLHINISDAWQFVNEAIANRQYYDLIIVDLTVASDVDSARFHSVDWYTMLHGILDNSGVIASNSVSPENTPWAYCSIFNSIALSGLHPRPYHVTIPSFAAKGYGSDWGFFMAAKSAISAQEIDSCVIQQANQTLTNTQNLRALFLLPEEIFGIQPQAVPALNGSAILLRYFNKEKLSIVSGNTKDALEFDTTNMKIPQADTGKEILPSEVSMALAEMINFNENADTTNNPAIAITEIFNQIPILQESHTPELIADFLNQPSTFLQGIDLPRLIERMLQHASQLPARFVEELKSLACQLEESASAIEEFAGEHLSARQLGGNLIMILSLVLVVGNLLYPDMVYAKGAHDGYGGFNNGYGGYYNNYDNTREIIKKRPVNTDTIVTPRQRTPEVEIENFGKGTPKSLLPEEKLNDNLAPQKKASIAMLQSNQNEATELLDLLNTELKAYEDATGEEVLYGMHNVSQAEAIRRTKLSIKQTTEKLNTFKASIAALANAQEPHRQQTEDS
jgi:spermidine synthase